VRAERWAGRAKAAAKAVQRGRKMMKNKDVRAEEGHAGARALPRKVLKVMVKTK